MQTIKQIRQSCLPKITKAIVPNNTLNSILQREPIRGPYECNIKSVSVYKHLSCLSFYAKRVKRLILKIVIYPIEIQNLCDWRKRN